MLDETRCQKAFLPGGNRDAMLVEFPANFLALMVLEMARLAHVDLQVVAVDRARSYQAGQGLRADDGRHPRWFPATGLAHPQHLVRHEMPMRQRDDISIGGPLEECRPPATWARLGFRQGRHRQARRAWSPAPILGLDQAPVRPQRRERGERTPFFRPSL